jgi:hypothetical protein
MTNKIWKTCVVGLMLVSPVVCAAATDPEIAAALAASGDGKYVRMAYLSSITRDFGTTCNGIDPAIIVNFAQASGGIQIDFYLEGVPQGTFHGIEAHEPGDYRAAPENWNGTFDSVVITAYGDPAKGEDEVWLDAVWGVKVVEGVTTYVSPAIDDPAVMIWILADKVPTINLTRGILNSLDAKLDSALHALDEVRGGNPAAAVNKLEAFVNEVSAQEGNQITSEDATILINGVPAESFRGALGIIAAIKSLYGL